MGTSNLSLKGVVLPDWWDEQALFDYRERYFNYYNLFRARNLERAAQNLNYVYLRQWIELDSQRLMPGARGYFFKDMAGSGPASMPRPVTNYTGAAVNIELAALCKKRLVPNILVTSKDPRVEAAARVAKEVLLHRLKTLGWDSLREQCTELAIITGTAVIKSFWDESSLEMTMTGNPDAQMCPNCGTTLSDMNVPPDLLQSKPVQHSESIAASDEGANLMYCPTCPEPTFPEPAELDEQQAQGADYFGRPLGIPVPKGNTAIELVSPFDLWPENMGVDVDPDTCRVWGQATVRSLDWLEERYPNVDIDPEEASEMMKWHPTLGDSTMLGWFSPQYDSGIYERHARLFELHIDKCGRYPDGRSILWAGDTLVSDAPLYRSVGGQSVATVKYAVTRFETIHRSLWGRGLVDNLISPQNRLNGLDSQIIDARERMGSPNILFTENMDVTGPEYFDEYGGGKFLRYQIDPLNPAAKPEVFGSILMPAEAYQERMQTIQDMKELAGPQDVEQGEAPRNVGTTSGLQLLYERSDQRRGPRERGIVLAFEKIWKHQLELLTVLRVDSDSYDRETPDGSWEEKVFDRTDLANQCKVKIEQTSDIEKSVYQKEAAREAQADGLIQLTSQAAIKRLLELRGLPTDINQDLNYQVDLSKRQFVDYVDQGRIPVIDPCVDDYRIHYQCLATLMMSDEGKDLADSMGWDQVLKQIAGWETELTKMELVDQQVRQIYSPLNAPEQNNEIFASATINYNQQMESFGQMGQANAEAGMPTQPLAPPIAPPPPVFMPADKADKIFMIWKQMIAMAQMGGGIAGGQPGMGGPPAPEGEMQPGPPVPEAGPLPLDGIDPMLQARDEFLKFMSVVWAYKLLAEEKELQAAMAMMPQVAAPGTPEGNPGTGGALPGIQASSTTPSPMGGPQPPRGVAGPGMK